MALSREEELWALVKKLSAERDMYRARWESLMGLGDATYVPSTGVSAAAGTAPAPPTDAVKEEPMQPLGEHISIMGLRGRAELKARARMRELQKQVDSRTSQ